MPRTRYAALPTEAFRKGFPPLDGGAATVRALAGASASAVQALRRAAPALSRAADLVAAAVRAGRTLAFFGAGTSGRLAVMEAAELWPTFRVRARGVIAGGRRALLRAVEGAEDDPRRGARDAAFLRRGDAAIGVTASGVTPWVAGALREARRRGAATVLVTSHSRSPIRADAAVVLATGAEPLAGSTRMNAGTAAKAALNALTTCAMARAGKTWRNRMVDVVATNAKLRDRARRLVADLGEVSPARANALLRENPSVKVAIAAARLGVPVSDAARRLKAAGGRLAGVIGV